MTRLQEEGVEAEAAVLYRAVNISAVRKVAPSPKHCHFYCLIRLP